MSNTNIFNLTGVGSNVRFGKAGSRLKMNGSVLEVRNAADSGYADFKAYNATFANDVTVTGNLTVNGTTTTVNSTTVTIQDPIINLGGGVNGAAPTTTDAFNRGIEFQWYDTAARVGFFGWDNASGKFVFKPDGTNLGTAAFNRVEAGDVTITGTTISNGTGDLTITPAAGQNLILSSLSGTSALLFADANKKVKSSTILWDATTLTVNNLTFAGSTIGTLSNADLTLTPNGTGKIIASTLTAGQVVYAGASKELAGSTGFTWDSGANKLTATNIDATNATISTALTVSSLTAGRVPYVGTAGLIADSSALLWDNGAAKLTATNITSSGTADLATVKVSTLTNGRLTYAGANGQLSDAATLLYTAGTDTVSLTNLAASSITNSGLTAGRITYAGTAGLLSDSSSLLWDVATSKLTATNITSSGTADLATVKVSTLTSGRVTYAGTNGQLSDSSVFTFNSGTGALAATSFTATGTVQGLDVAATSLTATRIVFSTTGGKLVDDSNLTYASSQLSVGNTGIKSGEINTASGNLKLAPASNVIDANSSKISNVVDPTSAQDVATKNYVDAQVGTGAKVGYATVAQANVTQSIKGRVHRIKIYVTAAYDTGATISVSDGTTTVVATADVDAQTPGAYIVDMFGNYATATTFTLSVGGTPAAGTAEWLVEYFQTAG